MENNEQLELEIARIFRHLKRLKPDTKEYESSLKSLQTLVGQRERPVEQLTVVQEKKSPIDWNVVLTCGTNILGIILMLKFEMLNNIGSKVTSFIMKPRI